MELESATIPVNELETREATKNVSIRSNPSDQNLK